MKKFILVIAFLLPICSLAQSQRKVLFEIESGTAINTQFRDKQIGNYFAGLNVMYKFNDIFLLGIGSQYININNFYVEFDEIYRTHPKGHINDFPIYAVVRAQLSYCNWRPFVDLRLGYSFSQYPKSTIATYTFYDTDTKQNHGLLINPKVGVEYNIKNTIGIYLALGFRWQRMRYNNYRVEYISTYSWLMGSSNYPEAVSYPNKPDIISFMKSTELTFGIRF